MSLFPIIVQVPGVEQVLEAIHSLKELFIMKSSELAQGLTDVKTQLVKVGQETTTLQEKIATLEAAITDADVPQEVVDAFNEVKAQVQVVDDAVPDAPVDTPPTDDGTQTP